MPDLNKVLRLIDRTLEQSQLGSIPWKQTADTSVFSAVIAQGKYVLKAFSYTEFGSDGEPIGPASLGLFDNGNKLLLDITYQFEGVQLQSLLDIYQAARDTALGINVAIDEVLDDLDNIPF